MGSAYTPGLKVSSRTTIHKLRRLPLKGDVMVKVGDIVAPDTVVARTEIPGLMQTVKVAERLGIEPTDLMGALRIAEGDTVQVGDVLAETKGVFGRYFRSAFKSPAAGVVEMISSKSGHVGIREAPKPVERDAYIHGVITEVLPREGAVVSCIGAQIQGIFGVGGERQGDISVVTGGPDEPLTADRITAAHAGRIIVGGSTIERAAFDKAAEVGAVGIVAGGVIDRDLMDYLAAALKTPGYDIGVAITGTEAIPFTMLVTEGFGRIPMANRTFSLLRSLEGKRASINGATQIRAGVIRPEVLVSLEDSSVELAQENANEGGELRIGTPIRIIREPYFGLLGDVSDLPQELVMVESETMVRVLRAKLADGREVTVPRANVEIIDLG
ncbi:MAG: hypothetical protein KGJ62_00365 [Armatimonadetes bacterium]|nr:hypothetical protein [Armatimonadota bacterium]MDE2207345.1 hypothetical protein [Armatimonadota bacterium]